MLSLPAAVRIYFFAEAADMRKGFDGLVALVRAAGLSEYSGHLFAFVSRRADRAKILTWERGGFVLWYKRLERGRFRRPPIAPEATRSASGGRPTDVVAGGHRPAERTPAEALGAAGDRHGRGSVIYDGG